MHELISEFVADSPAPHVLLRRALDDGALVALFGSQPAPRWVAKTAQGPVAATRLRREAWALGAIEPWAQALGMPRILGWQDAATPEADCCLVASGLDGAPLRGSLLCARPQRALPADFHAALAWLQTFQATVPPPRPTALPALVAETRLRAEGWLHQAPELRALLSGLLHHLIPAAAAGPAAVAVHGDFWSGNILLPASGNGAPRLAVVDWSGFDSGSALYDVFSLFAQAPVRDRWREVSRLQRWCFAFFAPAEPRDFLRQWATRMGYSPALARLAFYHYLVRRLGWEMGLDLQTRSSAERIAAKAAWCERLAWLSEHRFPDPFSALGAAC